jgi:hypothetical protein
MNDVPDPRQVAVVGETLENAEVIVSAFDHVGSLTFVGFGLAACCAMVEEESGGRMIWGADPWNPVLYPSGLALPRDLEEQPVTQDDYVRYRAQRNRGLQPQGCGICQLTNPELQHAAEIAGGCWVAFYNARTGFAVLRGIFTREPSPAAAFAAYNGSGPAAEAYGDRVEALRLAWAQRLAAAGG